MSKFAEQFVKASNDHLTQELNKRTEGGDQQQQQQGNAGANGGTPDTSQNSGGNQAAPAEGQNQNGGQNASKSLREFLKEQHGVDLADISDEEILSRVKSGKALGPASTQTNNTPQEIEVPEDEVIAALEQSGKSRDYYNTTKELAAKADFDVVKLQWSDELRKKNPAITDEEIDSLLKERFFISDEPDLYQPHEVEFGKDALKKEADRIRKEEGLPLETTKNTLLQQKKLKRQQEAYAAQVDQFISAAPKELTLKIGKRGANDLGEFSYPVAPEIQQKVAGIMKDPAAIAKAFSGPDGKIDPQKVYNLFLQAEIADARAIAIAENYHGKGVELVESRLTNRPNLTDNGQSQRQNNTVKEAEDYNAKQVSKNIGRNRGR